MHKDVERILFTEERIHEAVSGIAAHITSDYADSSGLIVVGILKGACVFMTDLIREIKLDCTIDFMVAKSYGNSTVSSGNVRILKDLDSDIAGMDVLIVEDILDTARTLSAVKTYLLGKRPASVKICTLLDKVAAEKVGDVRADYKCFDVENEFVVGYGLDYAEHYRNLPYIGVLKRSIYEH
ncbi:MAG: hypoxanthine phosphoribosyltransferase [Ruminiclostridium sp.]|nr:hypoxanthine phosphoribosyltransferase [Ruminiclostridium sp.]